MTLRTRVFGFTLLVGLAASVVLLLIVVYGNSSLWSLFTGQGLAEFGLLLVIAVLPASLPASVLGGWMAGRATASERYRSLGSWVVRGAAVGTVMGAIGSSLWFGVINVGDVWNATWSASTSGTPGSSRWDLLLFFSFTSLVGGVSGACAGSVVGGFCWCVTRGQPSAAPVDRMTSGDAA